MDSEGTEREIMRRVILSNAWEINKFRINLNKKDQVKKRNNQKLFKKGGYFSC